MSKNKDSRKAAYKKAREAYESMNAAQRGELLTAMIALYQKNQTQQNLLPVMQCLMDNVPVGVPMKVSQEDMEMIKAARDNKENAQQIKVSMKTVVLRHKDGRAYFPVFSFLCFALSFLLLLDDRSLF